MGKMKYEPGKDHDPETTGHATSSEKERSGSGSSGEPTKGTGVKAKYSADDDSEYDEAGKACKGGGYYKKGGKYYSMKKSEEGITSDDLVKSLEKLEALSKSGDSLSRKEELLAKAVSSDLSKSENLELHEILGGSPVVETPEVSDTITKSLTENEDLAKERDVDVSGYLSEQHNALVKSLGAIGDEMEKSDSRRHEFNLVLAKAVSDIGHMVKSLSEQVDTIGGQPARAPKSAGLQGAEAMNKSFAGGAPEGETMNKSQILDGFEALIKSGVNDIAGEDVNQASTKFEVTNKVSKPMLEAIKEKSATTH